jgi:hypothetical protein
MVIISRRKTATKPTAANEPPMTKPMVTNTKAPADDDELTQPMPEPMPEPVTPEVEANEVEAPADDDELTQPKPEPVTPEVEANEVEAKSKAGKVAKPKLSSKCKYGYELFVAAALECLGDDKDSFLEQLEIVANYIKNGPNEPMTVKRLQTANPDWTHEQVEAEHQRQCDMWLDRYPAMETPPMSALARYKLVHPGAKAVDFENAPDKETYEATALAEMKEYYGRHPEKKMPSKLKAKRPLTALALYKLANPGTKGVDAKEVKAQFEASDDRSKYESEAFKLLFNFHLENPSLPKPGPVKNQLKNEMKVAPNESELTALKLFKANNPGEEWKEQGADVTENYKALAKEAIEKFKVENASYFEENPAMIPTPFKLFACKMQGQYIEVHGTKYFEKMVKFWNKFVTGNLKDTYDGSNEVKVAESCKKKASSLHQFQFNGMETCEVDNNGLPVNTN